METITIRRREDDFAMYATSIDKAIAGLESVYMLIGLVLFVLSISSATRAQSLGRRSPFVAIAIALASFVIGCGLNIGALALPYLIRNVQFRNPVSTLKIFHSSDGLRGAGAFFDDFSHMAALSSAFLIMWNRGAALLPRQRRLGSLGIDGKAMLDISLLVVQFIMAIAAVSYAAVNTGLAVVTVPGITLGEIVRREHTALSLLYVYVAITGVVVADVTVSALVLHRRVSRLNIRDAPTRYVASYLAPLWIVHFLFSLAIVIWSAWQTFHPTTSSSHNVEVVNLISVIEYGIVFFSISSIILMLGASRTVWRTVTDEAKPAHDFQNIRRSSTLNDDYQLDDMKG
ncbi:hypothetical protein EXIGLDRAFT_725269 [Exidia glandulosa HHB12029]|uniref:Uncharacterized protein n=1 Tax=Exidia glandulosa HHB12029 TaxID=1314781 RepID=A0A165E306_EXIGL|nr:hypothetical protein EXIGLDRAFT_725269 [Exidia glandulosa HHB12029]